MPLAFLQVGGVNLAPGAGQRADREVAERHHVAGGARHRVPVGRLVDGARLDGGQDEAPQSLVPRAQVDVLVDAANVAGRKPAQDAHGARQARREGPMLGDHRVVEEDLADGGLWQGPRDRLGGPVADAVRHGAGGVEGLAVLESRDELGDDRCARRWAEARGNSRAVDALEEEQQRHGFLVAAPRAQHAHRRWLPIRGVIQAQQLKRRGRVVPHQRLQRRQRVRASGRNQDLVDELLAAPGGEERSEDLLVERVDEGPFGGGAQREREQVPEERVRVLRAQRVDALLPQGRVVGPGVGLHAGQDARLENVGGRQGNAARVEHGENAVRRLVGIG